MKIINNGKQVIKDYRRNKFWGKVKHIVGYAFWKSLFISAAGFFMVGGFYTAASIFTIH